jgi:hypothetical protein
MGYEDTLQIRDITEVIQAALMVQQEPAGS